MAGGGYTISGGTPLRAVIISNWPSDDDTWSVSVATTSSRAAGPEHTDLDVYALCVDP